MLKELMAHWDDDDEMCKMRAVNNSNLFFGPHLVRVPAGHLASTHFLMVLSPTH
jgi:hypothetical protein